MSLPWTQRPCKVWLQDLWGCARSLDVSDSCNAAPQTLGSGRQCCIPLAILVVLGNTTEGCEHIRSLRKITLRPRSDSR